MSAVAGFENKDCFHFFFLSFFWDKIVFMFLKIDKKIFQEINWEYVAKISWFQKILSKMQS